MADRVVLPGDGDLRLAVRAAEQPAVADPVRLLHHLVQRLADHSYHSYQSEIFPTHIRARAVGFCYSFSRLSTVFSSIIIGIILQYGGSLG